MRSLLRSRWSPLLLLLAVVTFATGFLCVAPDTAHAAVVTASHVVSLAPSDSIGVALAGSWCLTIRGTGAHHGGGAHTADKIGRDTVLTLQALGQFVREAKFELTTLNTTADGSEEVVQPDTGQHIDYLKEQAEPPAELVGAASEATT
jgi:hypothetical protein